MDISARSEITAPQGAGFATFKIAYQPGVVFPVTVSLIVESPKRLPRFPFEKYDGPVDRTQNEYMRLELASRNAGATRAIQLMPNGDSVDLPPEAFVFSTIEKRIARFLLTVKDGQKLSVIVNGPPSSIRVSFDTTGLKKLLDQIGLKHP